MNIHIEENIGTGKTTFLEFISKHFDCYISKEPVAEWMNRTDGKKNKLDKCYDDTDHCTFAFRLICIRYSLETTTTHTHTVPI